MEEHNNVSPLAATTHLLQHTLRSLCLHHNSHWVYAVFWRILPRNYPPPKWDIDWVGEGTYDRSRGNKRNWILGWEDGFCNFEGSLPYNGDCYYEGLQPDLFFKMSHEIYNYGEGLIGKVAADHSHKWIYSEPIKDQDINLYPRTWEAQFQCGIKSIALIGVREGVIQLGAYQKVIEDLSYVVQVRLKFSYIERIPGFLLPHPSSSSSSLSPSSSNALGFYGVSDQQWPHSNVQPELFPCDPLFFNLSPSMSSLEALLSKLPSVEPPCPPPPVPPRPPFPPESESNQGKQIEVKEDVEEDYECKPQVMIMEVGETSAAMNNKCN